MKEGTGTEWINTAGGSTAVALIGKLIPYILLFFANLMLMNIVLIRVMGTPLNGSLAMVLFSEFLLILAYQAMAIVLLTVTINLRLTLSLGSAYTMMALTFSGLTFPAMGMPLLAKAFSFVFPYTFLAEGISQSVAARRTGTRSHFATFNAVALYADRRPGISFFQEEIVRHKVADKGLKNEGETRGGGEWTTWTTRSLSEVVPELAEGSKGDNWDEKATR